MNKFMIGLHQAFYDIDNPAPEEKLTKLTDKEKEELKVIENAKKEEKVLEKNVRRNNEALSSSVENIAEASTDKELEKQLKNLAKNKKIDFPWTDNKWKCSRKEKDLATASAKVFQQLLSQGKLQEMINRCRKLGGELTEQESIKRKEELGINSKDKDIRKFYQAFLEYQNPQSKYQHLKNLMGFFCENDFDNLESVKKSLSERSKKISKKEINSKKDELYKNGGKKPKDWKQRASFEVIKDRLSSNNSRTDKMLTLLGDFNLDGEVNSGDVGYKTGSQFVDVFRRTLASMAIQDTDLEPDDIEEDAVSNLVKYAHKFGLDIDENIKSAGGLYLWMTDTEKGYDNTRNLQNFIKNLPIELSDVLQNGENAGKDSLENITRVMKLEKNEQTLIIETAEKKAEEIASSQEERLKELVEDEKTRSDLAQQLITQLPAILINTAEKWSVAAGTNIPLDQVIKGMSAGFDLGFSPDGEVKFGLFVGWDRKFDISDRVQGSIGLTGGFRETIDLKNPDRFKNVEHVGFVCIAGITPSLSIDVNKNIRDKSLNGNGENKLILGGNAQIIGTVFSYGFSVGYENNKQLGIEKQSVNINNVLKKQAKSRVEALQGVENTKDARKAKLMEKLKEEFPKSSDEEINQAADNLLTIIEQFLIDEQSTDSDFDTYAQIIADVYSEQWRNLKLAGLADKGRKISGGRVGIQFIGMFHPIAISAVIKFTKYRNARTNETEHSMMARIDAKVNGTGNGENILDSDEIGESEVDKINENLKRYGAKKLLSYIPGEDGKPGKISVPASISNGIGISVRVSQKLKETVGITDDGYEFPANAIYRLLQETSGNQRSLTLNIGSDKNEPSDVMISDRENMKTLEGNKELIESEGTERRYSESAEFEDKGPIEYRPDFIDSLFTEDVVKGLQTVDSSNRRKFSEFMRTKKDAIKSFDDMVNALKDVLGSTKIYQPIVEKLNDKEVSEADKQLIIDRVMAISAYANVHDKSGLELSIKQRGNRYKESGDRALKGPNGKPIFNKLEDINRDEFIKDLDNYESVYMPDVIGVTAFYNRNNKAQGLALTGLGATNVLGGKTEKLSDRDAAKAKEWFLGGIDEKNENVTGALSKEKSPQERSNVKRCVEEKLSSVTDLTDNNLKDLLKGEEVEFTIDNTEKKIKVKIETEYISYLMGECANESIGMRLRVLVKEQQEFSVVNYKDGELYVNNFDGSNSVSVDRSDRTFGIGGSIDKGNKNVSTIPGEEPSGFNTKPKGEGGGEVGGGPDGGF